jgi:hypothetical protein
VGIDEESGGPGARDGWTALALAVLVGLVYGLTQQERLTGDGAGLGNFFHLGGSYYNVAWLPAARFVAGLVSFEDPLGAPHLLSVLCGGVAAGFCFLLCRETGARRGPALTATLLLALSPAVWFFSTTIEVHAVHLMVVAAVAWVTLIAPWQRPALALGLVMALFPLLYWTQQTAVLLGPGWVFLVHYARARKAAPFKLATTLLVVGPLLLLALLAGMAVANRVLFDAWTLTAENQLGQIEENLRPPNSVQVYWDDWGLRPFWIGPLALIGLVLGRLAGRARLACGLACGLPLAFFLWWRVPERGGYFLGSAPFALILSAAALQRLFDHRRAVAVAVLLVATQAALARTLVKRFDSGWIIDERVELVREHVPPGTLFVSAVDNCPRMEIYLPEIEELSLWNLLADAWKEMAGALTPEIFLEQALPVLDLKLREHGRVVLGRGWIGQEDRVVVELRLEYYRRIEAAVRERYRTRLVEHPHWGLLIIEPPD